MGFCMSDDMKRAKISETSTATTAITIIVAVALSAAALADSLKVAEVELAMSTACSTKSEIEFASWSPDSRMSKAKSSFLSRAAFNIGVIISSLYWRSIFCRLSALVMRVFLSC
jgi:hypothetical protein